MEENSEPRKRKVDHEPVRKDRVVGQILDFHPLG